MLVSVQRKLTLALTVGLALTLALVAYLYQSASRYERINNEIQQAGEVNQQLSDILLLLDDAETGQRGYLLTGDPAYLEPYQKATPQIEDRLTKLEYLTRGNDEMQHRIFALRMSALKRIEIAGQSIQLYQDGRTDEARDMVRSGLGKKWMDQIRVSVANMKEDASRPVESRSGLISRSRWAILAATVALAVLSIVVYVFVIRLMKSSSESEELTRVETERRLLAEERFRSALEAAHVREVAEAKFRGLLEAAPDAMVVTDRDGVIALVNAEAEKLFGYRREELLTRKIDMVLPDRFRGIYSARRAELLSDAGSTSQGTVELVGLHKDGREVPMEMSLSPLATEAGEIVTSAFRDVTERKNAQQRLRALTGRLLQMQDEERRRIARELHDSAGQLLAALSMNLTPLSYGGNGTPPKNVEIVRECMELVDQLSRELRTISHLLHPPLLDEVGLSSALRVYLEGFTARSSIHVDLDLPNNFGRLSRDLETAVFRIVQECLTNIHRHSGSSVAKISLIRSDEQVLVKVEDRGKGIPQEKRRALNSGGTPGVGIGGMRERLRQLGGTLEIDSAGEGTGTVITARLPVTSDSVKAVA